MRTLQQGSPARCLRWNESEDVKSRTQDLPEYGNVRVIDESFSLYNTQVKKSKKWVCKVCGEKQSIKQVYAQGSGQDCRKHVQRLNMKCGEAQIAEDLAYDSDDNIDCCNISENTPSAVNVPVLGSGTTCEDPHTKLTSGQSKWTKFTKNTTPSGDDGAECFDGFNETTERDSFDKASTRGKRKWVQQGCKTNTYHKQKQSKNNTDDNHIIAGDLFSQKTENVTLNTATDVRHFSRFYSDLRMQALSTHMLEPDGMTAEKQCAQAQSSGSGLRSCSNWQANQQTSQNKCNVYFARATRDASPSTKLSGSMGNKEKGISCSSKWAKFMSSSSSSQNEPLETTEASHSQETFIAGGYLDKTTLPSQQLGEISQDQCHGCNSLKLSYSTSNDIEGVAKSLLVEDLFKVDDDLDGEWWNSL